MTSPLHGEPFAALTRKARWQALARRWRDALLRPLRPSRVAPGRDGPPNLLLVGVDTLRADHLGCLGCGSPTSPRLDRLAAQGTLFGDVTAPAPWTLPSFAGALTGLLPGTHGAVLGGDARNMDRQPPQRLRGDVVTLAAHLRAQGYRTAAFYSNQFFAFGLAESFDRHEYHNLAAGDLLRLAREWIRRHADRPFFCFVLLNDPHEPTTPPAADLGPFLATAAAAGAATGAADLRRYARWGEDGGLALGAAPCPPDAAARRALALKLTIYDATVHQVDREIGALQDDLQRRGLADSTLVSVFSDHGEEFLDHQEWSRRWDHDPRGLHGIGHGQSHFQELLHVPWLAWGPGVPAGVRRTEPVSLLDLAPTLLDWLGLPPLPAAPGAAPERIGRSQARPRDEADRLLLAEAIAYGPDLVALRRGRWKLIAHRDGRPLALFDLQDDPRETVCRREDQPEVLAGLLEELGRWRAEGGAGGGNEQGGWDDMDDTIRSRLKDLGYAD